MKTTIHSVRFQFWMENYLIICGNKRANVGKIKIKTITIRSQPIKGKAAR